MLSRGHSVHDCTVRARALTLAAGAALLGTAWIGLFYSGVPSPLCPLPFLTTIPAFLLDRAYGLAVAIPTALFFAWNPRLLMGQSEAPRRSLALFGLALIASVAWFWALWSDGLHFRGEWQTKLMCAANAIWVAVILIALLRQRRIKSFESNLLFHWLLFAWLGWYAFPYLGELP